MGSNGSHEQRCNPHPTDTQKQQQRKVVIAGDSILDHMKASRMKVDKISAVKLNRKGDNLAGTVSRTINCLSKHSNENTDLVLLVGTNDLSTRVVSPEHLINKFDEFITELKRSSNLNQIFLCKVPPRFDNHNINRKDTQFNERLV